MRTKHLKYLTVPLFFVHAVTYLGVVFPLKVFLLCGLVGFIPLFFSFYIQDREKEQYEASLPLHMQNYSRFRVKYFFVGLFLSFYAISSMLIMMGSGVSLKFENGKYLAMNDTTRIYYEIDEKEYRRRIQVGVRGFTALPLLFSYLGYVFVRIQRD